MIDAPLDILIIGAGLAGIGAARDIKRRAPKLRFQILEARKKIGGTWDLFRYPGLRSDSDFATLGYPEKPLLNGRSTATAEEILAYLDSAAREAGVDKDILFQHRVIAADFDTRAGLWRVEAETQGETRVFACRFLYMCAGYYDYDAGHAPDFAGQADFAGPIIHPQHWPENFDFSGKRLIVIGSGATAVTLVPALAAKARHVVMVQRSPTYIVARPGADKLAQALARVLPAGVAFRLVRWRNLLLGQAFYQMTRWKPQWVRQRLLAEVQQKLRLDNLAMRNFAPRYNVWDQRLCLDPDGGFFDCLLNGSASVVTGEIETLTTDGLRLRDGESFRADAIITATGLNLRVCGGARLSIDGAPFETGRRLTYKGCMFEGLPNFVAGFGYANAAWTLKCRLTTIFLLRLMRETARRKALWAAPRNGPPGVGPVLALSSNYVKRAENVIPQQGAAAPWRYHVNYISDLVALRFGRVADAFLHFERG